MFLACNESYYAYAVYIVHDCLIHCPLHCTIRITNTALKANANAKKSAGNLSQLINYSSLACACMSPFKNGKKADRIKKISNS